MEHYLYPALPPWTRLLFAVLATIASTGVAAAPTPTQGDTTKFENLVAWVRENGGRVDDRFGLTNHQHGDNSIRGGVALQPIEAGTELLFLPWKLVFGTVGDTSTVPKDACEVLELYASEVSAGAGSFWYPYLALDDSLSTVGRVPSLWSDSAIAELQGLPPFGSTAGLTDWFSSNCAEGVSFSDLSSAARQSLLAAITRAAGMRFLPMYDLLNHHNGLLNTKSHADVKGDTVTITRDIAKGEEIFMSYRGGTDNTVAEVYRRYGFVESWPQYWSWTDQGAEDGGTASTIQFLLLPNNVATIHPPDSMTSQIGGQTPLHLGDMLASTEKHNQGLSTERLVQFSQVGQDLISSLTTTEEDVAILVKMEHNLSRHMESDDGNETEQLRDLISAVDYRIHFKEAVQTALGVAENVLALRRGASCDS